MRRAANLLSVIRECGVDILRSTHMLTLTLPTRIKITGELPEIERLTGSSEGDCWKSTLKKDNSPTAYPTSSTVPRGGGAGNSPRLPYPIQAVA